MIGIGDARRPHCNPGRQPERRQREQSRPGHPGKKPQPGVRQRKRVFQGLLAALPPEKRCAQEQRPKDQSRSEDGNENREVGTRHPFEEDQGDRQRDGGGQEPGRLPKDVSELFSEHKRLR